MRRTKKMTGDVSLEQVTDTEIENTKGNIGGNIEGNARVEEVLGKPPATPEELRTWLRSRLGISIASQLVVRAGEKPNLEMAAPFDYVVHTFFEGRFARVKGDPVWYIRYESADEPPDSIVWACRGGGKTFLGAVATMLDMVFKPNVEVRILGGSLAQSSRMMGYLTELFEHALLAPLVASRKAAGAKLELVNGSRVEILAQSETSVRGVRVHKLRCDEVEMFSPAVWEAAQLTTKSMALAGPWGARVRGAVDAMSTLHVPYGLMQKIITSTRDAEMDVKKAERERLRLVASGELAGEYVPRRVGEQHAGRRIFRWDVLQSMQRCTMEHVCVRCKLREACGGAVRKRSSSRSGHAPLSDILALQSRVGMKTWDAEMLCLRPLRADCVFTEFDQELHVFDDGLPQGQGGHHVLMCGMDFGIRGETAVLWADVECETAPDIGCSRGPMIRIRILDEMHEANKAVEVHGAAIKNSPWAMPHSIAADPSGRHRGKETGQSCVGLLIKQGLPVTTNWMDNKIKDGLEMIRRALRPANGDVPRLHVHARCKTLIRALETLHYDATRPEDLNPVKDGPDHAVDALRYLMMMASRKAPRYGEWIAERERGYEYP